MTKPTDAFCVTPWNHLATTADGYLQFCCFGVWEKSAVRDELGQKVHLSSSPNLERIWNSPYMREIRQKMLNGETPEVCAHCTTEEKFGVRSSRMNRNHNFRHQIPAMLKGTSPDGHAPRSISDLDLRFGNLCNLGCRMCNPESSRYLIPEWKVFQPHRYSEAQWKDLYKTDWYEKPENWAAILSNIENVERIYLTGGEPMLAKAHRWLLKKCVEEGLAPRIKLIYNSNGTVIDPVVLDYWKQFKRVHLSLSIDGVGPLNEYIRFPSRWTTLEKHFGVLDECARKNGNLFIEWNVTVQAYNVLRIQEICDYLANQPYQNVAKLPNLKILNTPRYFNIAVLPSDLKNLARTRIRRLRDVFSQQEGTQDILPQLDAIVGRLDKKDLSEFFNDFARITRFFDQGRNQNLKNVLPELEEAVAFELREKTTVFVK